MKLRHVALAVVLVLASGCTVDGVATFNAPAVGSGQTSLADPSAKGGEPGSATRGAFGVIMSIADVADPDHSGAIVLLDTDGNVVVQVQTAGAYLARLAVSSTGVLFTSDIDTDYRIESDGTVARLPRPSDYHGAATLARVLPYPDGSAVSIFNYGFEPQNDGRYRSYASVIPATGAEATYLNLRGYPDSAGMCASDARVILSDGLDADVAGRLGTITPSGSVSEVTRDKAVSPLSDLACDEAGNAVFLNNPAGSATLDPAERHLEIATVTATGQVSTVELNDQSPDQWIPVQGDTTPTTRTTLNDGKLAWSNVDGSVLESDPTTGVTTQILNTSREPNVDCRGAIGLDGVWLDAALDTADDTVHITTRTATNKTSISTPSLEDIESRWGVTDVVQIPGG